MQVKVSDCIARNLKRVTDTVFGITGGAVVNLFDSVQTAGLRLVTPNHEQGAAMMADAFSRLRSREGKIGVVLVTSGPGATNALTGVACSFFDSVPVLVIAGQVPSEHLRKNDKVRQVGFQETDVVDIFKPVTKWATRIKHVEMVQMVFECAFQTLFTGRPGPVLIDICDDVQRAMMEDVDFAIPSVVTLDAPATVVPEIIEVGTMLQSAKKPVFIVGAGVKMDGSEEAVIALARKLNIPVALTWGALDILADDDPINIRDFGVTAQRSTNFVIQESDLLICLGTRLDTHETGSNFATFAPKAKIVVVDIDEHELERLAPYVQKTIHAPVSLFVQWVQKEAELDFSDWLQKAKHLRWTMPICPRSESISEWDVNPYLFMQILGNKTDSNAVIVTDAGCTVTWTMQGWPVKKGQSLLTAFNNSPMGYALPAAIGAYVADPKRQIICITGDGGFQMNLQELALLAHTNIKLFVLNNEGYGMMRQTQDTWLGSRYVGVDGPFGNEVKLAVAYDLWSYSIVNRREISPTITSVLSHEGPALIHVQIDKSQKIEPKLVFGKAIEYASPELTDAQIQGIREYLNE